MTIDLREKTTLNEAHDAQAGEISRRELLGKGTALIGVAVTAAALGPAAAAELTPNADKANRPLDLKGAATLPNLDPPIVQVSAVAEPFLYTVSTSLLVPPTTAADE